MKKIMCALILFIVSITCFSQEIKETSSTFPTYQGVVTTNVFSNDLYTMAKFWIAENFNSANDVIQLDSPENGTIICKGIYTYNKGKLTETRAHFTLKIETKDNRFRYTITIDDMRSGTQDVSAYSMYINNPDGKYATKFTEEFQVVLKEWMLGITNNKVNSTDEDW